MPELSILLPTYNGERYLDEQLETILAQTAGDFELIAVDDGSSDGTVATLERHAARDSRIRILPSSGNRGQNTRIVELLGHARGTFVAVADQDDRWALNRNEVLLKAIAGRSMAFGRSELIDAEGKEIGSNLLQHFDLEYTRGDKLVALLQPMFSAHAMLCRRDRMNVHAFGNPLPFDWLVALDALFSEGVEYRDDAVVHHRIHGGNQLNTVRLDRQAKGFGLSDLRAALTFQTPGRVRTWLVFDYLGRSSFLQPELRRTFQHLANRLHTVWFSEWRALRSRDAGLRDEVLSALLPLAGSEKDGRAFTERFTVLTRPIISSTTLEELKRRIRLKRTLTRLAAA